MHLPPPCRPRSCPSWLSWASLWTRFLPPPGTFSASGTGHDSQVEASRRRPCAAAKHFAKVVMVATEFATVMAQLAQEQQALRRPEILRSCRTRHVIAVCNISSEALALALGPNAAKYVDGWTSSSRRRRPFPGDPSGACQAARMYALEVVELLS